MSNQIGQPSEPAILNLLSGDRIKPNTEISCFFHGLQGKRLTMETSEPLTRLSPVSVKYEDVLFLGEVITCVFQNGGHWRVEIRVEQILNGLMSLLKLRSQLLSEGVVPAKNFNQVRATA